MSNTINLPPAEAQRLVALRETGDLNALRALVAAYRRAGWTLQAIGAPLGKGRSTVRLWEKTHPVDVALPDVPKAPLRVTKQRVVKLPPDVPLAEREKLRELAEQARQVRRWTGYDAQERVSSRQLDELLRTYQANGVNSAILARRIGVTHRAVRARLERSAA